MADTLVEDRPDFECAAYQRMKPGLEITNDLWGGTLDIRAQGTKYLEVMPLEDGEEFKKRLKNSVFFNEFQRTVESGVGMVFKSDPTPVDKAKTPAIFSEMFEDIDLQGSDLAQFLRETFTNAWRDGMSFILVDGPKTRYNDDGSPVLLNQVLEDRPWWINFTASQAINWITETIDGKEVLQQITFKYCENVPKGKYGEEEQERFLVLFPGGFRRYKKVESQKGEEEFVLLDTGSTGLDYIPLAIIYGRKMRNMESRPPLLEQANLNILHYQKTSDFDNWCHICCVPILTRRLDMRGDEEKSGAVPIGPTIMVNVFGQYGDLKYTEVSGSGLDIVTKRIKEIEIQMTRLGVEMVSPKIAVEKTATEVIADSGESQSQLAIAAKNLESGYKLALYYTSQQIGNVRNQKISDQDLGALQLNIDYTKLTFSVNQMVFFMGMVDKGYMSLDTFLTWLPKVTEMPKDFNAAKEIDKIKSEADFRKLISEMTSKENNKKDDITGDGDSKTKK